MNYFSYIKLKLSETIADTVATYYSYKHSETCIVQLHHVKPSGYWAYGIVDLYGIHIYKNY